MLYKVMSFGDALRLCWKATLGTYLKLATMSAAHDHLVCSWPCLLFSLPCKREPLVYAAQGGCAKVSRVILPSTARSWHPQQCGATSRQSSSPQQAAAAVRTCQECDWLHLLARHMRRSAMEHDSNTCRVIRPACCRDGHASRDTAYARAAARCGRVGRLQSDQSRQIPRQGW